MHITVFCGHCFAITYNLVLKLLRLSTVSAATAFISEAVDDKVETSAMKYEMLQPSSCLSCFCEGNQNAQTVLPVSYR